MSAFIIARDRDAWATLRGYVYQVDLTIERWLNLTPDQELQLECGEDIDLISRAHQAGEDGSRLLEQVKHRDSSITLRSDAAVEAIANAVEHRAANPAARLLFRFTTNARAGRERLSPLRGTAAIEAWEQVRGGRRNAREAAKAVRGIRTLLQDRAQQDDRPDGLSAETWRLFQAFVMGADDGRLLELIRDFEWSTGSPAAADMTARIPERLLSERHARDSQESVEQYYRLFLFVFKRLCERGRKVLTPEERAHQLRMPPLGGADSALLLDVRAWLGAMEGRLTAVEQTVQIQQQAFDGLAEQVRGLALTAGGTTSLEYAAEPPMLDLPPLVEHLSRRGETVRGLAADIESHAWTAVHGSIGSGKSLLAALAAEQTGTCRAWIRLRDLTTEQAHRLLDEACAALSGLRPQHDWGDWYSRLCRRLGAGALLVLDDLPQLRSGDPLSERLLRLAQVCRQERVHLLSTSNFSLPTGLQQRAHKQALATLPCPPLTDAEAAEILEAYGAPAGRLDSQFVVTVNGFAQRHPQILAAFAHYMSGRGWRWTGEEFEALLRSEYTETLNDETTGKLLETVEEEQGRELLYRLNTEFGAFTQDAVLALAAVEPVVARPRERLHAVTGLWVQRDAQGKFLVSPLIKALGDSGLPPERSRACHHALGDLIMRKGRLNFQDLSNAVTHFGAARAFNRAGSVLAWSLSEFHRHLNSEDAGAAPDPPRLLSFWWDAPLPTEMSLFLRLYLRTQQIVTGDKTGRDISGVIRSLESLISEAAEDEASAVLAVAGIAGTTLAKHDFALACRVTARALELLPHARLPGGAPLELPEAAPPSSFIWWNLTAIRNRGHVLQWLDMVEQIAPAQRAEAFADDLAEAGCVMLADRTWMLEAENPEHERSWQDVLETLQGLAERASRMDLHALWACARRAQIIVHAEYRRDLPAALAVAQASLERHGSDPRVVFLIKEATGRVSGYLGQKEAAAQWLEQALTGTGDTYAMTRFRAFLEAAWFTGPQEPGKAIEYLRQAVAVAGTITELPETELIKALCELAIAHWLNDDLDAAFGAYDEAAGRLLACREETDDWRGLFSAFGHVGGFLCSLARLGGPPPVTGDGEPYASPERGYFLRYTPRMAASAYSETRYLVLPEMMATFAEGVNRDDRTAFWALKGIEMARGAGQASLLVPSVMTALPCLLAENRFTDALDAMYGAAPALVASLQEWRAGADPLQADFDVSAVLGSREGEAWREAEGVTAVQALLPAFLRISTLAVDDFAYAGTYATGLSAACRQISGGSITPDFWLDIARRLEQVFARDTPAATLISQGNQMVRDGQVVPGVISLIGGTLQPGVFLQDALGAHLTAVIHLSSDIFALDSPMHRRIVLPFFATYWRSAFQRNRFQFSVPRLVEQQLAEVSQAPIRRQVKIILRTVADGLGGQIPDWVREWLASE